MSLAIELARQHLRPDERILWLARPSLIGIVPIFFYALAALVAIGVSTYMGIEEPGAILRGTAGLVVAIAGVLAETVRRFIRLRFTTFVVTDQRFYSITSFLETHARSVPLSRATHVTIQQGLAGRVLGFWQARVSTYGSRERGLDIPAIRDGEGLLRELSAGMKRGANVAWLRRGD